MQHIERGAPAVGAYHHYLQGDHDFRVWAEILTMEETPVAEVDLLDGQVNFSDASGGETGPDRTASVVLSDLDNALSFGTSFADDPTGTIWVNRLVRVKHEVEVPVYGTFTTIVMVGVPTSASQQGGEVALELADKSLLADHGVRPRTYKKGTNVREALVSILRDLTGERKFRIPQTKKTLSKPYTVGMGEDALTPWQAFRRIAGAEMGWSAYYSGDGYATCEPTSAKKNVVQVEHVLNLPQSGASFTDFANYAKVTSRRKMKNTKKQKNQGKNEPKKKGVTMEFEGVAVLPPTHRLSEQSLARHGVPRTLPLVVSNDNLKDGKEVAEATRQALSNAAVIVSEQSLECMPFFHLDRNDLLLFPLGIGAVPLSQGSLPLGTGGNMTIGAKKWVSRRVTVKRVKSKKTVIKKKQKGGKKNDE